MNITIKRQKNEKNKPQTGVKQCHNSVVVNLELSYMAKKYVPASQLAMYFADRGRFDKSKGRTVDTSAARAGTKEHEKKGKKSWLSRFVMMCILGVLCYLFYSVS